MGSGSGAGLKFGKTSGSLLKVFDFSEPTATVWPYINPTQSNYIGTQIPRSFTVDLPNGKLWTHGNATKHMNDFVISLKDNPRLTQSNPNLLSQFILYDYRKSLIEVSKNGIIKSGRVKVNHWEFGFSTNSKDKHTAVIHAKFLGFK